MAHMDFYLRIICKTGLLQFITKKRSQKLIVDYHTMNILKGGHCVKIIESHCFLSLFISCSSLPLAA